MPDTAAEEIVDVAFRLPGGRLPVDHAYSLFSEVSRVLPWFSEETAARLHQVHTAASGSGWLRPEGSCGDELHLSRRTRLTLRLPRRRAADALALSGCELDVAGYSLIPGAGKILVLVPADTLLARHVVCRENEEEAQLVARLEHTLSGIGIAAASLICGRAHRIVTPQAVMHTRSVVVTNLDADASLALLREGIAPGGNLGCGVFVPYKRIE